MSFCHYLYLIIFFGLLLAYILIIISLRKSNVSITTKRITGTIYGLVLSKNDFSYRLDAINDVHLRSTLGFNNVIEISFSQGNNVRNKHYNNKKSRYYHKKKFVTT